MVTITKNKNKIFYGIVILFFVGIIIPAYALFEFTLVDSIDGDTDPLSIPHDVVIDSTGRTIVADYGNARIQIYDVNGLLVNSVTNADGTGSGPLSRFISAYNVAVDSNDRIFVSDGGNSRVQVFDSDGTFQFSIPSALNVRGVTIDSNDRIIIAETFGTKSIQIYDSRGSPLKTITDGIIKGVWDVAVDSNDRIIAIEWKKNIFHIYDSSGDFVESVSTVGGIGQRGIAVDSMDRILISDQSTNQIHIYNSTADFVTSVSYTHDIEDEDFAGLTTDCYDRVVATDLWNHNVLFFELNIFYEDKNYEECYLVKEESKNKGGCGGDCTPPTFGKDDNGRLIVQGGFSFNGNATDITDLHTPYKMITASTNSTHNFTLKAYENYGTNNIEWFQLGVVSAVGDMLDDAEVLATIYIDSSQVVEVVDTDSNNLWEITNATSYIEDCGYITAECLELSLDVIFREELKNKVIVIQAMDNSRRTDTKFLNDGIETVGQSMNKPLVSYVLASMGGAFYPQERGVVELTLTSYKDDLWQDSYGYQWTSTSNGFRILDTIPVPLKEPDVMWQAMTRMNSNFPDMIIYEENRAVLLFDASTLESILDDSFAYDYSDNFENKLADPTIIEKLKIAEQNAIPYTRDYTKDQSLYQYGAYDYWGYFGDMSLDEIIQWDEAKKLQLKAQLDAQRLLEHQKYNPTNTIDQRLAEKEQNRLQLEEEMRVFNESQQ